MDAITKELVDILSHWGSFVYTAALLVGSAVLGLLICSIVFRTARRLSARTKTNLDDLVLKHSLGPARLLIPILTIRFFIPLIGMPHGALDFVHHLLAVLMIVALAWLLIRVVHVIQDVVLSQYATDVADNLRARSVQTQIQILRKIGVSIIGIVAFGTLLMTIPQVRQLGTSILASAGIISIIVGFAAQRSIATLLAGLQIALTQPIRIDDVVVVEGEWGRIEEITLTYVVVRIWDLRRLILPITYFLEKPFQNWTRVSAKLLGTVYLHTDYRIPVDAIRQELKRIAQESPLWDGEVCTLQVTGTSERTMELRALVSAGDSSLAWNLRCEIREKLIKFVQEKYPEALPVFRTELRGEDRGEGGGRRQGPDRPHDDHAL
jgi:small-conductance mechanosensitive channel